MITGSVKRGDLGIIADDLTGACDAAASFTAAQRAIEVYTDLNRARLRRNSLAVLNTQSRVKPADECKSSMKAAARVIGERPVVFKKIDTAFRGSVGAELEALSDALGIKRIVVAPAIPRIGRTTRGGVQYDDGIPIHRTPYSSDPASPVDSADVMELIRKTGKVRCEVRDAVNDADLDKVVEDGLRESKVLFVGSLGLADALAKRVEGAETPVEVLLSAKSVLIVCGSRYDRSRAQVEKAAAAYGTKAIEVSPAEQGHLDPKDFDRKGIAILCLSAGSESRGGVHSYGLMAGFTKSISDFVKASAPDALGMIGGETAYHLLGALDTGVLRVFGRISDVMPFGTIADGNLSGCCFATKGGSVGTDDSIIDMIRFFKGER